ncbi:cytochrome b561 domain-containing protein 2 isoform X2 [Anguilla anguilla]|uniref:cytochrome b561 domain-containing protein 2 isoform X2 n=1 Tax=Anguilla anguilla TaxID=7936 RepID=UPI0015B2F33E|nr:cytochrome b561 domain-containing protein 2 isoform X2 [Anguilla anguilla]
MAQVLETEPRIYHYLRATCGVAVHVLCLSFTVFIAALARPGSSLFSWHPFLMTLAKFSHKSKARYHWILQCLCVACAGLGLAAISYNKHLNGKPHFSTWHGLVGLLAACGVAAQSAGGLPLLYHRLVKGWSLARLKRYHAVSGLLAYLLGSSSLMLGMCSLWFTASVHGASWYLVAACPALSALFIMSQVTNAYMAKKALRP